MLAGNSLPRTSICILSRKQGGLQNRLSQAFICSDGKGSCGAAPLGSARNIAANMHIDMTSCKGRRARRRGLRSALAVARRKLRRIGGAPVDAACGESQASASILAKIDSPQPFLIYCINIRCLLSNLAELCVQVKARWILI